MSNDLLRMVVIAAVAYTAYHIFLKDGNLIKNTGTLNVEGDALETYDGEEEESVSHPQGEAKSIVHSQIQDISRDEIYKSNPNVLPNPQMSNNFAPQGNFEPSTGHNFAQLDCFPKDSTMPQDLLPKEGGFSESNPAPQGHLNNRNFFESGYTGGLNTQSNTLKNANRQLRSDPLIPRRDVGPWAQSTYEPDTNRRQFDIGSA